MSNIVNLSEAASIALNGLVQIAKSENYINSAHIAENLGSSKHHVAKVMQILTKNGYIRSFRGPSGGFVLNKAPEEIRFIDVYELIEGKLEAHDCPFFNNGCKLSSGCILQCVTNNMTKLFYDYMVGQTVAMHLNKEINLPAN